MRRLFIWIVALVMMGGAAAAGRPPNGWDMNWVNVPWPDGFVGKLEWHDGEERMSFPVVLPPKEGAGWVLALPGKASRVEVAGGGSVETVSGWELPVKLHGRLNVVLEGALATQVYPLLVEAMMPARGWSAEVEKRETKPQELDGIACRVVDARTREELAREVKSVGIDVPPEWMKVMGSYADGAHCFALFWTKSAEAHEKWFEAERASPWKGLTDCWALRFPSRRPIFPAWVVGDADGPIGPFRVRLNGHWEKVAGAPADVRTGLFRTGSESDNVIESSDAYTRVTGMPAGRDVAFVPAKGGWVGTTDGVILILSWWPTLLVACVAWAASCSYLCGGLAGLAVGREWRGFARAGLWNLGTIFLLAVKLRRYGLPRMDSRFRRRAYLYVFSLAMLGINLVVWEILSAVFGSYAP